MPDSHEHETHADGHDRDKLERWRRGLDQDQPGSFPVCAVFLVSESDQEAHDSFRRFRDSFESRDAGFHHLVIFGQHGVSTTVRALLTELSLTPGHLPYLVITSGAEAKQATVFPLPPGNRPESPPEAPVTSEAPSAETLLGQVESAIDGSDGKLGLGEISGGITRGLGGRTLTQVAASLLAKV